MSWVCLFTAEQHGRPDRLFESIQRIVYECSRLGLLEPIQRYLCTLHTLPRVWKCQASRRQIPGLNPPWSTFCHPVCTRNGRGLRPSGRIYRGRVDNAEYLQDQKLSARPGFSSFLFSFFVKAKKLRACPCSRGSPPGGKRAISGDCPSLLRLSM